MRAGCLVLLAACWHEPAARTTPTAETGQVTIDPGTPLPSGSSQRRLDDSPYREVAGVWRGNGFQYNTNTHWDFVMTLSRSAAIDEPIGSITYEGGKCTADLIRQPERGDILAMTEKMVIGMGQCVDGGTIRIPRHPVNNELDWRWDFADGKEGAVATPRRD